MKGIKKPGCLLIVLMLLMSACASMKDPGTVNDAKKALKAADSAWKVAQTAFAEAYLEGKLKAEQVDKFRALDRKVLMSGRLLRDAVKAWDAGSQPDVPTMSLLTTNLLSLMVEGAKLAAEFNLNINDLVKVAEDARRSGAVK